MKWGLIGASDIAATRLIEAFEICTHQPVMVMSGSAEHAKKYAADNNILAHTNDLAELLADDSIEAVYISSTNEKHCAQTLAAFAADKHVLCEKPIAMNLADATEMVNAAKAANLVFATNHHLRSAGTHIAAKQLVADGRVGQLISMRVFHAGLLPERLASWRINNPATGGGVIPDITVHDGDTVRFHLEEDPISVIAAEHSSAMVKNVEDSVMSIWQMPSGIMVQTHDSFTHRYTDTGFELHGTEGSIFVTKAMTQDPVGEVRLVNKDGDHQIEYSNHNLYARNLEIFAKAVAGNGQPASSGIDGLKSMAIALAVKQAAVSGKRTEVDYAGF